MGSSSGKKGQASKAKYEKARDGLALARTYIVDNGDDEQLRKDAMDVVNAGYWADVRGTAADYLKRAKAGEFSNDEELRDDLQQHVDGNYWVIYTYWARICLACSNNTDAYQEEMGEEPKDVSQQAYFAFMADLSNHPDLEEAFAVARGEGGED